MRNYVWVDTFCFTKWIKMKARLVMLDFSPKEKKILESDEHLLHLANYCWIYN